MLLEGRLFTFPSFPVVLSQNQCLSLTYHSTIVDTNWSPAEGSTIVSKILLSVLNSKMMIRGTFHCFLNKVPQTHVNHAYGTFSNFDFREIQNIAGVSHKRMMHAVPSDDESNQFQNEVLES